MVVSVYKHDVCRGQHAKFKECKTEVTSGIALFLGLWCGGAPHQFVSATQLVGHLTSEHRRQHLSVDDSLSIGTRGDVALPYKLRGDLPKCPFLRHAKSIHDHLRPCRIRISQPDTSIEVSWPALRDGVWVEIKLLRRALWVEIRGPHVYALPWGNLLGLGSGLLTPYRRRYCVRDALS